MAYRLLCGLATADIGEVVSRVLQLAQEVVADTDAPPCSESGPAVSVVVPTFREAENLPALIPAVSEALDQAGLSHEIIIVDDDSADGTKEVVADLKWSYPVRMLVRHGQRGLAGAVLYGFRHARGKVLACMDADGSHPPEKLPDLVRAIVQQDADIALGSRFTPGGSTDDRWTRYRRWNSKLATFPARLLTGVRDPMSGYFALPRQRFESAARLKPIGYKILLEVMVRTDAKNCAEIPIHFRQRRLGRSKLTLKVQAAYAWQLLTLLLFRLRREFSRPRN